MKSKIKTIISTISLSKSNNYTQNKYTSIKMNCSRLTSTILHHSKFNILSTFLFVLLYYSSLSFFIFSIPHITKVSASDTSSNSLPRFWVGGVTSTSARICVETSTDRIIKISTNPNFLNDGNILSIVVSPGPYHFSCGLVEDLIPDTVYYYSYSSEATKKDIRYLNDEYINSTSILFGDNDNVNFKSSTSFGISNNILGKFNTFPPEGQPASFQFGFASCEKWYEKGSTWEALSKANAEFFIHMGDLFYEDITVNNVELYKNALFKFLSGKKQINYITEHPIMYMWDDHDFADNDSGTWVKSRPAALSFYETMVPHYNFTQNSVEDGVYQAFTYGKVRFIMTDLRSKADAEGISTLGTVQKKWLFKELDQFKNYSMVVWVSTKPWIGKAEKGDDKWFGYADERKEISNYIAKLGIHNLVMIAGDAHMLAIDDGSNTDYSTIEDGRAGFPVMQSAPLAQYGSAKGGPYSEGCYSYRFYRNYHYSLMQIDDNNESICFKWLGYDTEKKDPVFKFNRCINKSDPTSTWMKSGTGGEGKCSIKIFPTWISVLIGITSFIVVLVIIYVAGSLLKFWNWKLQLIQRKNDSDITKLI